MLTPEQIEALVEVCGAELRGTPGLPGTYVYVLPHGTILANYVGSGTETYQLTLAGERVVMEKLCIQMEHESINNLWRAIFWHEGQLDAYYGEPMPYSQAIEAACIEYLSTREGA